MTEEMKQLRDALSRVKYEAASLADAQVIALEALTAAQPAQAEREAFEAWAASLGYNTERDMFQRDMYQSTLTWELWRVWQARASLPTQPAQAAQVPDVDDLRDRLVAISAAVANCDDRAAQSMLGELLRMLAAAQAKGADHV